jgi:hypothetical protein
MTNERRVYCPPRRRRGQAENQAGQWSPGFDFPAFLANNAGDSIEQHTAVLAAGASGMDFDQRLKRAIERGEQSRVASDRADLARQLSAEELRSRYSAGRIEVSEHIENCLRKLVDHFPGFNYSSIVGDTGWGAKIVRDDLSLKAGRAHESQYSRLELVVTPKGTADILEVVAKGTIRNREVFHRRYYQRLVELDVVVFNEQIDAWVVEYAEQFAAQA